eukprot:m.256911 g.256911  ORF g.256911 m.256911 type:complete len:498 (+) comp20482_c0_seq1:57-1550(+)
MEGWESLSLPPAGMPSPQSLDIGTMPSPARGSPGGVRRSGMLPSQTTPPRSSANGSSMLATWVQDYELPESDDIPDQVVPSHADADPERVLVAAIRRLEVRAHEDFRCLRLRMALAQQRTYGRLRGHHEIEWATAIAGQPLTPDEHVALRATRVPGMDPGTVRALIESKQLALIPRAVGAAQSGGDSHNALSTTMVAALTASPPARSGDPPPLIAISPTAMAALSPIARALVSWVGHLPTDIEPVHRTDNAAMCARLAVLQPAILAAHACGVFRRGAARGAAGDILCVVPTRIAAHASIGHGASGAARSAAGHDVVSAGDHLLNGSNPTLSSVDALDPDIVVICDHLRAAAVLDDFIPLAWSRVLGRSGLHAYDIKFVSAARMAAHMLFYTGPPAFVADLAGPLLTDPGAAPDPLAGRADLAASGVASDSLPRRADLTASAAILQSQAGRIAAIDRRECAATDPILHVLELMSSDLDSEPALLTALGAENIPPSRRV